MLPLGNSRQTVAHCTYQSIAGTCSKLYALLRRNLMTNLVPALMALFLLTFTSVAFTDEPQDSCAGGFSHEFHVGGLVYTLKTYYLEDLQALPSTRWHDVTTSGTGG